MVIPAPAALRSASARLIISFTGSLPAVSASRSQFFTGCNSNPCPCARRALIPSVNAMRFLHPQWIADALAHQGFGALARKHGKQMTQQPRTEVRVVIACTRIAPQGMLPEKRLQLLCSVIGVRIVLIGGLQVGGQTRQSAAMRRPSPLRRDAPYPPAAFP